MTTPKKPLSKTESAIQLGNVLKYGARGGSTKAGILSKIKKLLVKSKPTKSSSKITEVQTRPKKSLQNQNVAKPTRSATEVKADHDVFNRAVVGRNLRTHSGGAASEMQAIKKYIKARGPLSKQGIEKTSGIPSATGRLLKQKKVLKNQKIPKIKYGSSSIETTESLQGLTKKHGEKLSPIRKAYLIKKQKLDKKFPPPKHLN